jgi:hypothetical protein
MTTLLLVGGFLFVVVAVSVVAFFAGMNIAMDYRSRRDDYD